MSEVQAIAFYKNNWSKNKAIKWLKKHDYKPIKEVHETKNMLHYRITDPSSGYKGFISKNIGPKEDILLTIGLRKGISKRSKRSKKIRGGELDIGVAKHERIQSPMNEIEIKKSNPIDFQEVYPLSKESGLIQNGVLPPTEYNRSLDHDRVSVSDKTDLQISSERSIIPDFADNTLLGYMMKSKSKGGVGFPFPTSASTYSPMDWLSMSMWGR